MRKELYWSMKHREKHGEIWPAFKTKQSCKAIGANAVFETIPYFV